VYHSCHWVGSEETVPIVANPPVPVDKLWNILKVSSEFIIYLVIFCFVFLGWTHTTIHGCVSCSITRRGFPKNPIVVDIDTITAVKIAIQIFKK
jgi:hypothetical protein